jgi:voltage-gated potassium channel
MRRAPISARRSSPLSPRLLGPVIVPAVLIAIGTTGYRWIEGWSFGDALYMAVITLTTVGFGEVHPLSADGRWFTIFLSLGGIFTLFYAASESIRVIVSGEVGKALFSGRMERKLMELKDHTVVCGYGRMGRFVCRELSVEKKPFVVIEKSQEGIADFELLHGIALQGDASHDEVLRRAGIERAKHLVSVLASDADNLYITMSARLLNERLFIVTRAEDERSEEKMIRAGASRVISPYAIGGFQVAQALLRPTVLDFIELATRTEHIELQIEETRLALNSRLVGSNLQDSGIRKNLNVFVLAIKKTSGKMIYNPPGNELFEAGDILIALGHKQQLTQLDALANG